VQKNKPFLKNVEGFNILKKKKAGSKEILEEKIIAADDINKGEC
jgi:hypothetical protein